MFVKLLAISIQRYIMFKKYTDTTEILSPVESGTIDVVSDFIAVNLSAGEELCCSNMMAVGFGR